jgi:hypothetical protein
MVLAVPWSSSRSLGSKRRPSKQNSGRRAIAPETVACSGAPVRQSRRALDACAAQERAEQLGLRLGTCDLDYDQVVASSHSQFESQLVCTDTKVVLTAAT